MTKQEAGTRVTATDLDGGESETVVITDNYVVICDGTCYITGVRIFKNGTAQFWVKGRKGSPEAEVITP